MKKKHHKVEKDFKINKSFDKYVNWFDRIIKTDRFKNTIYCYFQVFHDYQNYFTSLNSIKVDQSNII